MMDNAYLLYLNGPCIKTNYFLNIDDENKFKKDSGFKIPIFLN